MKVDGLVITQAQIDACLARMKAHAYFRKSDIIEAAVRAGVPRDRYGTHGAVATRLLMQERKAGRIIPANRSGVWRNAIPAGNGGSAT